MKKFGCKIRSKFWILHKSKKTVHASPGRRISCSSPARSTFQHVAHGDTDVDLDCLLLISIFYNKQQFEEPWPPLLVPEQRLAHDCLHNVIDRPHKLSNYDLCLRHTDPAWHRPLAGRVSAYATKNKRTRGEDAQRRRQAT